MVVKPEIRHVVERQLQEFLQTRFRTGRGARKQRLELRRGRKLALLAKAAVNEIGLRQRLFDEASGRGGHFSRRGGALGFVACQALDHGAVLGPQPLQPFQHTFEFRRWQVQRRVHRIALGRDKHIERPTALTARAFGKLNQARVERGLKLTIHFHGNEMAVEKRGDVRVAVGLALHHMAPVAGEIADGDE